MPLTDRQRAVLSALVTACDEQRTNGCFVLVTEWLGYLPYGAYLWIEAGAVTDVEARFPAGWERDDLHALEELALVEKLERKVLGDDGFDTRTTYRITVAGTKMAAPGPPPAC